MANKKVEIEAKEILENAQISDIKAMEIVNQKNIELAKIRRQHALEREERLKANLAKIPSVVEAKNSLLLARNIKHSSKDMIINLPFDNDIIKILALNNYEHLGNALYSLRSVVAIRTGREKINKLFTEIDKYFTDNVIDTIKSEQKYALSIVKNAGMSLKDIDKFVKRSDKPIEFQFRSRDALCSKWLNWCYQADSSAMLLCKLSHLALITEIDHYNHVRNMVGALDRFARFIYSARSEALFSIRESLKKSKDEESLKILDDVESDLNTQSETNSKDSE